eukprot:660284-Rhodomonas_salina.2
MDSYRTRGKSLTMEEVFGLCDSDVCEEEEDGDLAEASLEGAVLNHYQHLCRLSRDSVHHSEVVNHIVQLVMLGSDGARAVIAYFDHNPEDCPAL